MGNSLLAVRYINHKYIVVERKIKMCESKKTKNVSYYYCPNCKCEVTPNYHEYCDFCGSAVITVDTYSPEECRRAFKLLDLVNSGKVKLSTAKDKTTSDVISSEYSEEFDKLRKNRMEVSFFKYGSARDNYGSGRVDAIKTLELCVEKFKKTGNTEYLVDAANYAMLRFMYPLPGEYFKSTCSNESAGIVGTPINMENNLL